MTTECIVNDCSIDYSINERQSWEQQLRKLSIEYRFLYFDTVKLTVAESVLLFLKNSGVSVVDELIVKDFIDYNPVMATYLYEAPEVISKHFEGAKLNLELFFDPEIENDNGKLFLNILIDLEPKEALDRLEKIDREWLLPVVGSDILKFNLNIEII